jgi:hypothetical protein
MICGLDLKPEVAFGAGQKTERKSMKKFCTVLSLAGVMAAPNLFASMTVTMMDNTPSYSYGNGGEFRAVSNPGLDSAINWNAYSGSTKGTVGAADVGTWGYSLGLSGQEYFQTFCIEYNEEFSPGTTYNVTISEKAMWGSQPPPPFPGGDPISIGTAWLYSQFAAGTLSGYNYNYGNSGLNNRTASAGALQQAIWWLEGEANGVNNSFVTAAETALGLNDTTIKGDANGAFNVRALNLGDPGTVQDQLVIVPEPTTVVAGALLLLPFGMSTLRILRKKQTA